MLEMTYPDDYYKNVIEPAKLGKGPVPSMGQMMMKSQPFKAVSLPFQEMMNPGKYGSFRSSGTPMARAITGPLSTAARGLFSGPAAGIMAALTPTPANADEASMTVEDFAALNQGVTPTRSLGDVVMEARTNEPMDIEDFLGTSTPQDLGFIGNAPTIKEAVAPIGRPTMADIAGMGDLGNPTGDPRVVSEEMGMIGRPTTSRPTMADVAGDIDLNLTDLGNPLNDPRVVSEEMGMVGFPGLGQVDRGFQDVLDAREARATQIANQQNPNYGQFFRDAPVVNTKSGLDLGTILSLGGLLTGELPLKAAGLFANRDKIGRMAGNVRDRVSSGLGSLNRKMRGVNPDGTTRTQRQYEAAREQRRNDRRVEKMLERKAAGKSYSQKNLNKLTTGGSKPGTYTAKGAGSGGSPGSKIVCTMMNERYGFGSFRNKIWMKFHESYGPEYQKGYHAIFLPLVKIAKGEGKINTAVRKVLEHMGRHVTADMFKIMKGKKRDPLGRIYRAIFEPTCRIIGKIKSALGRG